MSDIEERAIDFAIKHPLASKRGLETVVGLLFFMGAMCPKCGYGTRRTSKNWARCKRCGERVRRRPRSEKPAVESSSFGEPEG